MLLRQTSHSAQLRLCPAAPATPLPQLTQLAPDSRGSSSSIRGSCCKATRPRTQRAGCWCATARAGASATSAARPRSQQAPRAPPSSCSPPMLSLQAASMVRCCCHRVQGTLPSCRRLPSSMMSSLPRIAPRVRPRRLEALLPMAWQLAMQAINCHQMPLCAEPLIHR